ncbi:(R,S)-reticuline 7-O-methyltransferase-like [Cryptomeria japonica]|uniref:(R,S)-reticuline 7-O-methyltransferase-like n=1 Tax=Cryptomeria japonica TaxID=3369 RepID=UPI0027DAA8EF|nr:(R,S)-reticuline 7-O-methyltransferase-like [Cryptomeria japonica]
MNAAAANSPCTSLFESEEEEQAGQAEAWKYTFAFVDSLAVKSVVLLGIPDIIARHGAKATLSLSQIAAELPTQKPDVNCLFRILRFLVAKNFFRAETTEGGNEVSYGLTPASKWMLKDGVSLSMRAMLLMQDDVRSVAPWHHLNECILEGGVAFEKAHGLQIWDYAVAQPQYSDLFNQAMACNANIVMKAVLSKYEGFQGLNSLVDVGGGIGVTVAEIVKAHPTINGINYDLPHVIATAPHFPGVKYVGGDMFKEVPSADAVIMKMRVFQWVFCFFLEILDWGDEDCVKILKQCRKAIPETGKVIILDSILNATEKTELDPSMGFVFDLIMLTFTSGGKERSEEEWKNLLKEGGFPRFNVIAIPALQSVIEAFPY